MTSTTTMTHPNGVQYIACVPGYLVKVHGQYSVVRDKKEPYGVIIKYPDGVRRFISNSWYD